MNEIEKMYENCNIKPKQEGYCDWDSNCPYSHHKCNDECPYWKYEDEAKYPPFTAKKQLELIKWLAKKNYGYYSNSLLINVYDNTIYLQAGISCGEDLIYDTYSSDGDTLEEAIAKILRCMWNKLTEEERKQIKNILESEVRE